jgi:hypothetical protein
MSSTIGKDTFSLTKGEFADKFSRIVEAHRSGTRLIGKPRDFVITACRLADRFSKVANEADVEVRVENWPCGPRKVKMAVLKRADGFKQPIPKQKLVDALYPPRVTKRAPNLERKHVTAVRAAMRQLVDSQLRAYRKTLQYPLECHVTGKQLRPGMRVDIDHLGKPFVQIADDWVASLDLTYCDFVLVGPPNLKKFKDRALNDAWSLYHEDHARLIAVCAAANRSKGSGDYTTPSGVIGSFEKKTEDEIDLVF